jgi:hypothetical protein
VTVHAPYHGGRDREPRAAISVIMIEAASLVTRPVEQAGQAGRASVLVPA